MFESPHFSGDDDGWLLCSDGNFGGCMAHAARVMFCLGLLWSGSTFGAYALMTPPPGVVQASGSITGKGLFTVSAGAFQAAGVVQVGGKAVTVPASWRLASNAGQFAVSAVRLNPLLAVGAVATWLALEYVLWDGSDFVVPGAPPYYGTFHSGYFWQGHSSGCTTSGAACSLSALIAARNSIYSSGSIIETVTHTDNLTATTVRLHIERIRTDGFPNANYTELASRSNNNYCPSGYTLSGGACLAPSQIATQDVWDALAAVATDSALAAVMQDSPLPLQVPQVSPFSEPLADPYIDPITGLPVQRVAHVQGAPTPESPLRLQVQEVIQPMTSVDPETAELDPNLPIEEPPFELPLFCDWAGPICDFIDWFRDEGEEPEVVGLPELDLDEPGVTDYFPSSGTCPAPFSLAIFNSNVEVKYDAFCDFASAINPLIIAAGALSAALIIVGGLRRG